MDRNRITVRGISVAAGTLAATTVALTAGMNAWAAETTSGDLVTPVEPVPAGASVQMGSRVPYAEQLDRIKAAQRREARARAAARAARAAERREASRSQQRRTPTYSGDPRSIAADLAATGYGWGSGEFDCLDALWNAESGWSTTAQNSSSGAYGIPQALPGSKMSAYGSDWQTNPVTQIQWGLAYINDSYGSPCSAWSTFQAQGWY